MVREPTFRTPRSTGTVLSIEGTVNTSTDVSIPSQYVAYEPSNADRSGTGRLAPVTERGFPNQMATRIRTRTGETHATSEDGRRSSTGVREGASRRPGRARDAPTTDPTEGPLLRLQRTCGNRAVQRLVTPRDRSEAQPELEVGRPDDAYEREAERTAERVMRMPDPATATTSSERGVGPRLQRMCPRCRERFLQGKPLGCADCERTLQGGKRTGHDRTSRPRLQRACACGARTTGGECEHCREARLQRSIDGSGSDRVPSVVAEVLRSPGRPLEPAARRFMEDRFGRGFGHVRVHTDAKGAESARAVNAQAYTVGSDIVFGSGRYAPETTSGRRLLAHELTHVVQQGRGGSSRSADVRISHPTEPAEREARDAVTSVADGRSRPSITVQSQGMQRADLFDDLGETVAGLGTRLAQVAQVMTQKTGSFSVSMKPFKTGVEGTIEFTPDPAKCPVCKLIRLVQIVRVFEKPGVDYTWTGAEAGREKVKTTEDKKRKVEPDFFVDHFAKNCTAGKGCSLYYRDHASNPSKSQDGSNDGKKAKKASLWDRPRGPAGFIFEFETCARCDDTGVYLRCVDWGFRSDSKGKVTLSATSEHLPSATFFEAVSQFDKYYKNP